MSIPTCHALGRLAAASCRATLSGAGRDRHKRYNYLKTLSKSITGNQEIRLIYLKRFMNNEAQFNDI
jgi:hypothetical protein